MAVSRHWFFLPVVFAAGEQKQLAHQRAALIQTVSHVFRIPLTILHGRIQTLEAGREEIAERIRPLIVSLARAEARWDEMVSVVAGDGRRRKWKIA